MKEGRKKGKGGEQGAKVKKIDGQLLYATKLNGYAIIKIFEERERKLLSGKATIMATIEKDQHGQSTSIERQQSSYRCY